MTRTTTTYLDVKASAKRLGISENTLRRRIADGTLAAYRVGKATDLRAPLRIRTEDLDALLTRVPVGAP